MEGIGNDDEKSQVETFISITSASREEALFFLESHNFQLDAAIHSFFENAAVPPSDDRHHRTQELGQDLDLEEVEEVPASASAAVPRPLIPATGSAMVGSREERNKKAASRASGSKGGGIRTLEDLNRQPGPGSDSDSDGPQEYYTGGEKSGMLVQDPNRGPGNDVDAIFDQARQMGALQGPLDPHPSSSSRNFTGTGRLLSGETVPAAPRQPENVVHNINFWSNGFTVNDGPLRRFEDPANAAFLESIKKSECPKELEPEDRRSGVHVNLIRKGEDYPEPVKRLGSFQGVGRTLGNGSSSTDSVAHEPSPAVSSPSPSPSPATATATAALLVDDSLPTTSIQLRFADGSRMVARFNTHHSVGDIRSFINHHTASQGGSVPSTYRLQTVGFPPKQLTDTAQTIEEAGLANSVVIQKL